MTRSSLGARDLSLALAASVAVHGLAIAGFLLFDPDVKAPDHNVPVEIVVTASSGAQAEPDETTERSDPGPARAAAKPKPTRPAAAPPPSAAPQERAAEKPPSRASDDAITVTRENAPPAVPAAHVTRGRAPGAADGGAPAADTGAGQASAPSASTSSGQVAAAGAASSLGDGPPRYRLGAASTPAPGYPYQARKRGAEGRVVLRLDVGADGRVTAVSIQESSGHDVLDRAAMEALSRWRLEPAVAGGRPAASQILVPVRFRLDG